MNSQEIVAQLTQLVQAAMQGDQQALLLVTLFVSSAMSLEDSQEKLYLLIIALSALLGDLQAQLLMLVLGKIAESMQQDAAQLQQVQLPVAAKHGTKLEYIRNLKGQCPEGYEILYMATGGGMGVCPVCQKKKPTKPVQAVRCGGKAKKTGAVSKAMEGIKAEMAKYGTTMIKKNQLPSGPLKAKNDKKINPKNGKPVSGTTDKRPIKKQDKKPEKLTPYEKRVLSKDRAKHTFDGPMASEG